jgi:hypothetical protein
VREVSDAARARVRSVGAVVWPLLAHELVRGAANVGVAEEGERAASAHGSAA